MDTEELIKLALKEDIGLRDITTDSIVDNNQKAKAKIIAKEAGIICGLNIAKQVFMAADKRLTVRRLVLDKNKVKKGDIIMQIIGPACSILKAERTALNFLQRLSGIATLTNKYSLQLKHARVYDTRKTTPLLRELEKYAVKTGGGFNHRFGLFDQVLIKENHIAVSGGIARAIKLVRQKHPTEKIEIEVRNLNELKQALKGKAEIIMLDNMSPDKVKECLQVIKSADYDPVVEVSGGITLENIKAYDLPGVARISVGSLTHSAGVLDVSLVFDKKV